MKLYSANFAVLANTSVPVSQTELPRDYAQRLIKNDLFGQLKSATPF